MEDLQRLVHAVKIARPEKVPTVETECSLTEEKYYNSKEYQLCEQEQIFLDKLRRLGYKLGVDVPANLPEPRRDRQVKKTELNKFILSRMLNREML